MKAAIALLADYPTQNIARRMVIDMLQKAELDFFGSILPSHVSLKQPFEFEDLAQLEVWFDSLAARTHPLPIRLDSIYYSEWAGTGILGFQVVETPRLRALHNLINQELVDVVKDPTAPHDGEGYRFHLTIELGLIEKTNPYKALFDDLPEKKVDLAFHAENLAMFLYADKAFGPGSFIVYRVMPLWEKQIKPRT